MTIAFRYVIGVHSVWCFSRRSEHIDIDAASFGIRTCEAGILRSWHVHVVPVDHF
jgi:hypothetical protein